jgi:hypothetical protein
VGLTSSINKWQFCIDPQHPEPIPNLAILPNIRSAEERSKGTVSRHTKELIQIPGVISVDSTLKGIEVRTTRPELLPKEIEGIPVIPLAPMGTWKSMGHTRTKPIRPLHGAVLLRDKKSASTA